MSLRPPQPHPSPLLRLLLAYRATSAQRAKDCNSAGVPTDSGLTLIECLVAIVIITLTVMAITPPIFVATATRIQSRRAEQANQIAQAEVDRVRAIVEQGTYAATQLPASAGNATDANTISAAGGSPSALLSPAQCNTLPRYPDTSTSPPAASFSATQLVAVDVDGDCKPEFAMQVFRTAGCTPADLKTLSPQPAPYSFTMGVRVYSYKDGETLPTLTTERATLSQTTGSRDGGTAGSSRKPMQVLISRVTRSGSDRALECATADNN